jgi:hypothetical protein
MIKLFIIVTFIVNTMANVVQSKCEYSKTSFTLMCQNVSVFDETIDAYVKVIVFDMFTKDNCIELTNKLRVFVKHNLLENVFRDGQDLLELCANMKIETRIDEQHKHDILWKILVGFVAVFIIFIICCPLAVILYCCILRPKILAKREMANKKLLKELCAKNNVACNA